MMKSSVLCALRKMTFDIAGRVFEHDQNTSFKLRLEAIRDVAPEILNHLRQVIEPAFHCACIAGEPLPMPEYAYR